MKRKLIHIWQFPEGTTILIDNKFVEEMNSRIQKVYSLTELHRKLKSSMPFTSFKSCLKKSYRDYRPLWLILKICKKLRIDLRKLESSIIAYRTKKSRITIQKPKLPISVSPIFHMLMAHLIGDGGLIRFKDKESVYAAYTQYNDESRTNFIKRATKAFGEFNFRVDYLKPRLKVFLPETVTKIIMDNYGLTHEGFLSKTATIPLNLEKTGKESLLAILIAFIIDEGNVDSGQTVISLKNQNLAKQLGEICKLLDYKNTVTMKGEYGVVYILRDGMLKFWSEYKALCKKFPEACLGCKEWQVEQIIRRSQKPWKSMGTNKTKNAIVELLKSKPLTIKEISETLLISRQGIKYHLNELKNTGVVSRQRTGKNTDHRYFLEKSITFKESEKGRSRQTGQTKKKILKFLAKNDLTTLELATRTLLERNSLMHILRKMEKNREINRVGKKYTGAQPTVVWGRQIVNNGLYAADI